MIGGVVIATDVQLNHPKGPRVWINCREANKDTGAFRGEPCGVFVEASPEAQCVSEGDSIWWQGSVVFWTTKSKSIVERKLKKIGFSGVANPAVDTGQPV